MALILEGIEVVTHRRTSVCHKSTLAHLLEEHALCSANVGCIGGERWRGTQQREREQQSLQRAHRTAPGTQRAGYINPRIGRRLAELKVVPDEIAVPARLFCFARKLG